MSLYNIWSQEGAHPEAKVLWAAASLAFFGFLRSGEMCGDSLLASDIAVDSHDDPTLVRLLLRSAKNDPFGKGVYIYMYLGRVRSAAICPVAAVLNYLVTRSLSSGPLLLRSDGTPVTRPWFVTQVRAALSTIGIDHTKYSGHSFRIGAATAAAAVGFPDHIIKMLGRWSSEAYSIYIRTAPQSLAQFTSQLAK